MLILKGAMWSKYIIPNSFRIYCTKMDRNLRAILWDEGGLITTETCSENHIWIKYSQG